jgi:hypothetical protein
VILFPLLRPERAAPPDIAECGLRNAE